MGFPRYVTGGVAVSTDTATKLAPLGGDMSDGNVFATQLSQPPSQATSLATNILINIVVHLIIITHSQ